MIHFRRDIVVVAPEGSYELNWLSTPWWKLWRSTWWILPWIRMSSCGSSLSRWRAHSLQNGILASSVGWGQLSTHTSAMEAENMAVLKIV